MKNLISFKAILVFVLIYSFIPLNSQNQNQDIFTVINLDYKGLENVKKLHTEGKDAEASAALLTYFKNRKNIINPDLNLDRVSISKEDQAMADDAMEHKFFSHEGFKPSLFYGKDIDWNYWPVKDNELRWQLHRQKWFIPMGKAFRLTGDEKWAKEWTYQYMDWIQKNPLIEKRKSSNLSKEDALKEDNKVDQDNMRYAWRPLEVSARLQLQYNFFQLFNSSKYFTPDFFNALLLNTQRHANYIINNYSAQGNHLLFEAQRILNVGILFPEFKDAPAWRKSAIDILNNQMSIQIYDDGMQNELDPMYHIAMIDVFCKALNIADINGYRDEFPQKYKDVIEKMIAAYYAILLPDWSLPMFSDCHGFKKDAVIKSSKSWLKLFPNNEQIKYFASDAKEGAAPASFAAMKTSGFYSLRSGWDKDATALVYKGGPAGEWHCQLDNGTFNVMVKGRNFFPDAGSYSYGGDEEIMKMRNWFRQTKVHNTLTLNEQNLEKADTKCLLWKLDKKLDILVTENPSYKNLTHRRSVFFVDKMFFVIVDEAIGTAIGKTGIHYQMCEGDVKLNSNNNEAVTNFDDGNNLVVKTISDHSQSMVEEEGWVSYESKVKNPRKAFAFNVEKKDEKPVRFITVLLPVENGTKSPEIKADFEKNTIQNGLQINLKIGKQSYKLKYQL